MYHSLRITPSFIEGTHNDLPFNLIAQLKNWYLEPDLKDTIIVEECESNIHYHILIKTEIPITTIRSRIKKNVKCSTNKYYCLKKQKEDISNLDKAYRYLYKGANANTLPNVIKTYHNQEEITDYHKRYWLIHGELIENESLSNVEKAYKYLALTYQSNLTKLTDAELATEITYNKVSKGQPPLPFHTLTTYIQFIRFKAETEFSGEDLKKSILDYFTEKFA